MDIGLSRSLEFWDVRGRGRVRREGTLKHSAIFHLELDDFPKPTFAFFPNAGTARVQKK